MSPEDCVGITTPDWWYRLVRDKVPATLPEGEFEVLIVEGHQKAMLLAENLCRVANRLRTATETSDEDGMYVAAGEVIETMSALMLASGANLDTLDQEVEDAAEDLGGYVAGWFVRPTESALQARRSQIK